MAVTYPENPCSEAPLRPGEAPIVGCACVICLSLLINREPVKPYTPEWDLLLEKSKGVSRE